MMPQQPLHHRRIQNKGGSPLYQPSIYRYTCWGAFHVSSQDHGSRGTCRGLRSQLELLEDMDRSTRESAISKFTYVTDYGIDAGGDSGLNQQAISIVESPALIYKNRDDDNNPNSRSGGGGGGGGGGGSSPEEELIKRQKWNCYGPTEVEYLVLKDPKSEEEHVAAVAPRNVLFSIRRIEKDDSRSTIVGFFGKLNVVVSSDPPLLEDEDEQQQAQQSNRYPSSSGSPHSKEVNAERETTIAPAGTVAGGEVPPRPDEDTLRSGKEFLIKGYKFGGKFLRKWDCYWRWLGGRCLRQDLPSRMVASGTKTLGHVPKTVDRTVKFAGKMAGHVPKTVDKTVKFAGKMAGLGWDWWNNGGGYW